MANYANLKSAIQQVVKTNGNNEITGALLQQSLLAMIDSLGGYYQFAGIATPSTNPGTPDQNVFYIASTAGTYSNFGGIVLAENEAAILKYNGSWVKESSGFATAENVNQLRQKVTDLSEILSIDGKYFDSATHTIKSSTNYKISDYIPVKQGQVIAYKLYAAISVGCLAFFDTNKNFVSELTPASVPGTSIPVFCTGSFICPSAGFILISCHKNGIADAYISLLSLPSITKVEADKSNDALFDIAQKQDWNFGALNASDIPNGNTTRIVTPNLIFADAETRIKTDENYNWYLYFFNSSGTRISTSTSWMSGEYTIPKGSYYRVSMRKNDDSVLSLADSEHIHLQKITGFVGELYDAIQNMLPGGSAWALLAGTVSPDATYGWSYSTYKSPSRVCIDPNSPLQLKKGSLFNIPSGFQIYIIYRVNNVYYNTGGWISGLFTCPEDGEYVFTYAKNPETDFTEPTLQERVATLSIISADDPATIGKLEETKAEIGYEIGKAKNVISVARLGYMPNSSSTPPEQSIASYTEAYKHGYRYMLADVQWTSDGVPVALHDESINAVARNADGTAISGTIDLSTHTLAEIDAYDFGIIKGSQYAGMKIMRIADFIRWCKIMNCTPILEVKDAIAGQEDAKIQSLATILKQFGMARDVIFEADAGYNTSRYLHNAFPYAAIGRTVVKTTDFEGSILTQTLEVKGENRVFWALYLANEMTGAVSNTMLQVAFENDIDIYCTEVPNYASFLSFISDDNNLASKYVAITGGTWDAYMNKINL